MISQEWLDGQIRKIWGFMMDRTLLPDTSGIVDHRLASARSHYEALQTVRIQFFGTELNLQEEGGVREDI